MSAIAAPRPPAEFDPLDQAFLAEPFPMLERMRTECPVFFSPDHGFWGLMRYEDIQRALSDHGSFANGSVRFPPVPEAFSGRVDEGFFSKAFIAMDPPEHTPYRKAGQRGFTRGRMRELEEPIRAIANELVDEFVADGRCELMEHYCYALTIRTIMLLTGIPASEMARMKQLAEDFPAIVADGIDPMSDEERHERWQRMVEVRDLFREIVTARRAEPGSDIVSMLVASTDDDGQPLFTDDRIITHMSEFIFAGTDTTANLMASTVLLLERYPEQAAAIRADRSLIPNALEEVLRRRSPTVGIFKTTTCDVEVGGHVIPSGSLVWMAIASAGQDAEQFPDPEAVDIRRANASSHLTFGKGRHMCLGAPLTRAEGKVGMEVLLDRLPGLRVVPGQQQEFQPILLTNVLKSLEVEWDVDGLR